LSHGLWRYPGNERHRYTDIEYWIELARLLERGLFDAVFLADVVGVYDIYRKSKDTAVREAVQIPNNDPFLVVPIMASVTKHLGFAVTSSTTYEPPFSHARRISTLDHLTKGRIGWNIVTSHLPNAANNFGLGRHGSA
jgi:alkanesulfonate monooxygenase SsuD/methylene tetrahydromethanopterin reductase-like flavin-dependent oxidoreductase (luciferase family)